MESLMSHTAINQTSTTEKAHAKSVKQKDTMANSTGKTPTSKKSERQNREIEPARLSNVDTGS